MLTKLAGSAALFFAFAGQPVNSSIQAFHRAYGPKSSLLVSSPILSWEVWPSSGARVTSSTMSINGQQVNAIYDEHTRRLTYQPNQPLLAGTYRVQCKVVVDKCLTVSKDWSFQILNQAIAKLPAPTDNQDLALQIANSYRQRIGLPSMEQESRLNAAALAHSKYLSLNRRTGHYEKEGEPGFIGATPSDRLEAFGYCGSSWECVTYNSGTVQNSVRDLFDAPYHRIPFLQPGIVPFGSGFAGKNLSIKFGDSGTGGSSVSPGVNQADVPTKWNGNESPNPLRMHPNAGDMVGYPVVFANFSEDNLPVSLVRAWLKTSAGDEVECFVNSPENDDHLDNAIMLLPKKPLKPNTSYSAHVEVLVAKKQQIIRDWVFQTGDD